MLHRGILCSATSRTTSFYRPIIWNDSARLTHSIIQSSGSTGDSSHSTTANLPDLGRHGRRLAWSKDQRALRDENKHSSLSKDRRNVEWKSSLNDEVPLQRMKPDPYKTSAYVKKLLIDGKFDEAVEAVKESPKSGLDIPVWNKLLHYAMTQGKYQVAYSLYIEVRTTKCVYGLMKLMIVTDETPRVYSDH